MICVPKLNPSCYNRFRELFADMVYWIQTSNVAAVMRLNNSLDATLLLWPESRLLSWFRLRESIQCFLFLKIIFKKTKLEKLFISSRLGGEMEVVAVSLYIIHTHYFSLPWCQVLEAMEVGNDFCLYEKHSERVHFYTLLYYFWNIFVLQKIKWWSNQKTNKYNINALGVIRPSLANRLI